MTESRSVVSWDERQKGSKEQEVRIIIGTRKLWRVMDTYIILTAVMVLPRNSIAVYF